MEGIPALASTLSRHSAPDARRISGTWNRASNAALERRSSAFAVVSPDNERVANARICPPLRVARGGAYSGANANIQRTVSIRVAGAMPGVAS